MEILRSISILWSLVFALVFFLMLYDLRFSRKKNILISCAAMVPLIVFAVILFFIFGTENALKLIFVTLTIPSLIFFFFMSEKPDGRFFFTFCLADTIGFELVAITMLVDQLLGGDNVLMLFFSRLIIFPLLAWVIWKYFRRTYLELQKSVKHGWWLFAVVSVMYYILLGVVVSKFSAAMGLADFLVLLLIFIIMPLTYMAMFGMLVGQKRLHDIEESKINADKLAEILNNELMAEKEYVFHARKLRHDLRHNLRVVLDYIDKGNFDGVKNYLAEYEQSIIDDGLVNFCENEVVNALFRIWHRRCREQGIAYSIKADLPAQLPYSDVETGSLFGNLLENAYEAADGCEDAFVSVTAQRRKGNLYVEMTNSVSGEVAFEGDLPISTKSGDGIGMRSVQDILAKYGGLMRLKQEGNVFIAQIIQKL